MRVPRATSVLCGPVHLMEKLVGGEDEKHYNDRDRTTTFSRGRINTKRHDFVRHS